MIIQYLTRKIDIIIKIKLQIRRLNDQIFTLNWNAENNLLSTTNILDDLKPAYNAALDLTNSLREYDILTEGNRIKNLEKEYIVLFSKFSKIMTYISENKQYENLKTDFQDYCQKTPEIIIKLDKKLPTITISIFKSLWFSIMTFLLGLFANFLVKLITM